jgi:hypothetical protein
VLVVGTAADGALYYSVKRSGFEDSPLVPSAEPFGFEAWKPLRLGESLEDRIWRCGRWRLVPRRRTSVRAQSGTDHIERNRSLAWSKSVQHELRS